VEAVKVQERDRITPGMMLALAAAGVLFCIALTLGLRP